MFEILLNCDKDTLRNLLNTCHEINKLADEYFWSLKCNQVNQSPKYNENWLNTYKRHRTNYGKDGVVKKTIFSHLNKDDQLYYHQGLVTELNVIDYTLEHDKLAF